MFDLDRAIAEWRTAFERDAAFARHEIDELEAHLRDSVAERIAAGERLSEAFDAVRASLGTPSNLRADFEQVDAHSKGWIRRLRLLAMTSLGVYIVLILSLLLMQALIPTAPVTEGSVSVMVTMQVWQMGIALMVLLFKIADVLVYFGVVYMLFKVNATHRTRAVGVFSLALWGAAAGISGSVAGLLPYTGYVAVLTGLASAASYMRHKHAILRVVLMVCTVGFTLFQLWRIGSAVSTGEGMSILMTLFSFTASGVVAWAAWKRWATSPLRHRVA
ncbi:MAG: hypothetical protein AAF730_05555 [Bacteroidota bacterium]